MEATNAKQLSTLEQDILVEFQTTELYKVTFHKIEQWIIILLLFVNSW